MALHDRPQPDAERAPSPPDLPRVAPPPGLRDSILAAVATRPEPPPVVLPTRAPTRGWRRIPRVAFPAGVALAALVAALVIAVAVSGGPGAAVRSALVAH